MPVKGGYLAITGLGALLLYSGLKGKKLSDSLRQVIAGKSPANAPQTSPITDTTSTGAGGASNPSGPAPSAVMVANYKAFARGSLLLHGWPTQWNSFNSIVIKESNWNNQARNPSGAYGIAQALGHGTANTAGSDGTNAYGNYGTPDSVCKAANNGNGIMQISWMANYIAQTYGSPDNAWSFHMANGYY